MSTNHEMAEAIRAPLSSASKVTGSKPSHATVGGKRAQGYLLTADGEPAAFIQVIAYDSRIGSLLERLTRVPTPARAVVRSLLNAEDYTSTMYDGIVRVHYNGEFVL